MGLVLKCWALETTRTSITRLKPAIRQTLPKMQVCLKRQEPRLRDWNSVTPRVHETLWLHLKRQEPRLRDWNILYHRPQLQSQRLETTRTSITRLKLICLRFPRRCYRLETTRTSITRLKLYYRVCERAGSGHTWNDKNLDYEIETFIPRARLGFRPKLETTRTSITRLKRLVHSMSSV